MPRALVAIALVVAAVVAAVAARPSAAEATVRYVPPVDAPVVDAFRPPPTPFAAGNRGLEYATAPGTDVRAAADGEVVFAGQVAGSLHVTVLHADGIRTSYSFLATIAVHEGDDVRQGDVVGTAGPRLFFGARVGDEYVDPALLLGGGPPAVHLVPLEGDGVSAGDERRALAALSAEHRWPAAGALAWLRDRAAALPARLASSGRAAAGSWRAVLHEVLALDPVPHVAAVADAVGRWRAARQSCTPPDRSPPPTSGRRIAVLVGGLGSSSLDAAVDTVDTAALGYAPADVVRFSYAGGRTPDPTDGLTTVPATAYTPADTQRDLAASGAALADLLTAIATAAPGVPVDVIAHSQGGLVARLALDDLASRAGAPALPAVLVTLGTPHGGADLATAVAAAGVSTAGASALGGLSALLGLDLDARSPAIAELAETSDVVAGLAGRPPPAGVKAVSIAARGDLVVPTARSALAGAALAVVPVGGPTAHDRLPGTPEATREIALALAGMAPTCESLADVVRDAVTAEAISLGEDVLGLAAASTGLAVAAAPP